MKTALTLLSPALLTAVCAAVAAEPYPVETGLLTEEITPEELHASVAWLADDAREGRGLLTEGLDEAAEFAATHFAALGLEKPEGGGFDRYFQAFDVPFGRELIEEETSLSGEGVVPMEAGVEFIPYDWSNPGEFEGEFAFAGYGISNEEYDDYADIDVKDKVVLVLRYEPHDAEGNSRLTGTEQKSAAAQFFVKARAAERAGAKALLIVNPPNFGPESDELAEFGRGRRRTDLPVFQVTQEAANALLEAAGLPRLVELQERIDSTGEPASQLGNGLVVSGGWAAKDRVKETRNVAGILRGKKADEYVVLGAHFDHVGRGEYGSRHDGNAIHNGADDNASGTAAVLEVAETLALEAKAGNPPERSVIFVLFTAEELGLIGSEHFVRKSPVPTEQMVGMVNLDMVGRIRDETLFVGGQGTANHLQPTINRLFEESPLSMEPMDGSYDSRSDHANFIRRDIPSIFLFSGMHPQYHGPEDDVGLINFEGLADTAQLAKQLVTAMTVASEDELAFTRPAPRGAQADGPRLGVRVGEATSGVGIADVAEGSAAAQAGIQQGDILVSLDGKALNGIDDLRAALGDVDTANPVPAIILRGNRYLNVDVDFSAQSPTTPTTPTTRP